MRHLGLYEGMGGFSLAAKWMGWETVAFWEIDTNCQLILKKNFPNTKLYGDVTTTDFSIYRGLIDILTGGEPCQPHSKAGKRLGSADARYHWPHFFRAVREIKPSFIVNENVRNSINTGALDQKISDLESEGYTCWPPILMPSGATEAIHERYRVWLAAYSNEGAIGNNAGEVQSKADQAETKEQRQGWEEVQRERSRAKPGTILNEHNWKEVASELCRDVDGLSRRVVRNQMIGNSIDPHIVYEIFKAIQAYDDAA